MGLVRKLYRLLKAMAAVALFGYPAKNLKVVGVTGTDGKTTTVNIIYWILKKCGKKVSMISTVGAILGKEKIDTGLHTTTPSPFALQHMLRKIKDRGSEFAVLEVSSHGLDQYRVLGSNFHTGVLTNITNEHLDYHKTYDNYLNAKSKLLTFSRFAVVNADDKSFKKITNKILSGNTKLFSYSDSGLTPQINRVIKKRFSEPYNQMNAYAAVLAVKTISNLKDKDITEAIKTFPGVPGRMQEIKNKKGIKLIVDFAHTPNGLENVLQVLKRNTKGKLIVVFGCAGERDYKKRPEMGKIATKIADLSVFTAEDPRHEQLIDIFKQMKSKLDNRKNYIEIEDRKEAIAYAINHAKKGDTVVVCGKGPEKSIAFGDTEIPWSDIEISRKIANE